MVVEVIMMGTIFNIQRFCVNDGPGIRTTVFLKGCPLRCTWCHNPESKEKRPQIMLDSSRCVSCGRCADVCRNHEIVAARHIFARENCSACGNCVDVCLASALEKTGYEKGSDEIVEEVLKDIAFYKKSGGGMTLSGGEPMAQLDFTLEILKKAKEKDIHVCMETCGHASQAAFEAVARYVDIFLYDYKISDPDEHYKYTGVSSSLIMSNLWALDSLGKKIILRCPIIPSVNDNSKHFSGIARVANELENVLEINIEPYHPLGAGKAAKLDMEYPITDIGITEDTVTEKWIKEIASHTAVPVKKA